LVEVETIDVKEQVIDLPNQILKTADGITIGISGAISYEIVDVKKLYLNVQDHEESMQVQALMEIADYVGTANFDQDELSNEELERQVLPVVTEKAAKWGINVLDVGITHLAETGSYFMFGDETVGGTILAEE
jgi:regulator of protease activity HflC (stomatin/prohibitin superfamily)